MKCSIFFLCCIMSLSLVAMQAPSIGAEDSSFILFYQGLIGSIATPQDANEVFSEELIYELIQGSIKRSSEKHALSLQTRLAITVTELLIKKQILRLKLVIELCDEQGIKFDNAIEINIMSFIEKVHAAIASRELEAGNFKKNQFSHTYDFEQRLTWMVKHLIRVGNPKSILTFIKLCNRENIVLNDSMWRLITPFFPSMQYILNEARDERARL